MNIQAERSKRDVVQWKMSYATHYGTFKICLIRQSVGKLRFYGSIHIHKLYDHDDCEKRVNYLNIEKSMSDNSWQKCNLFLDTPWGFSTIRVHLEFRITALIISFHGK